MRNFKYFSDFERLAKEVRFQAIIIYALLFIVLLQGFMLYRAATNKTVIVIPPKTDKEFWVSGETLSYAYIEQVAVYLADSLLSVSPANVDKALSRIMPFLTTDPAQVKEIRDSFAAYAKAVKENDWWQAFYPMRIVVNEKQQRIDVYGVLRKMTGNIYVGQENNKVISFNYEVRNGRLIITGVKF
jgi:type IV conjugative transfer system protein TraE